MLKELIVPCAILSLPGCCLYFGLIEGQTAWVAHVEVLLGQALSSTVTLLSLHWLKFTCMAVTNFKGS
jgi:hypothetical protein